MPINKDLIPTHHVKLIYEGKTTVYQRGSNTVTATQYKASIKALGLAQEAAGLWLGIGKRTSQGYALGEYPVPEPIAKLLRLMIRLKLNPEDVK